MENSYYAVIFTSRMKENNEGYPEMAQQMEALAMQQEGYLGIESARSDIGITVSYWKNPEAIARWKQNIDHLQAQAKGRKSWYESYHVRICKVEREYCFGE
jgi:heme-degrading monooxygenase HmoA